MRAFVLALSVFAGSTAGSALTALADADAFEPNWKPTLTVSRTTGSIHVDGDLTDSGWRDAARTTGFAETNPGDQVRPPVESEAWVTYDSENLYVALIAFDDPGAVRASLRERDNIFRDDYFGVMLDTYGDFTWGYEIFVNPLGIQGDLRIMSDGNEDMAFDIVYESEGRVTEKGYQVELAIPFASLRFPDRREQAWHINFWRDHQRDIRRRYSWAAQDRDSNCFMCNWGTLTGIIDIRPGSNIDIIPSAVAFQDGALRDFDDPRSDFDNQDPEGSLSLNVRYGLSSSASAEATLNPDFSQVESDAVQIDVNSPFALFFPERRPFFQEGSDLYTTWVDAIHTRSIADPDGAVKLTGQFGRTSLLFLSGQDDETTIILPTEEFNRFADLGQSVSNILRARHAYGEGSYVGALVTDRRFIDAGEKGSGTTFGIDGRHRFTKQLQLELQVIGSHTREPALGDSIRDGTFRFDGEHTLMFDDETFSGNAAYVSLERDGRTWFHDIDYWEFSSGFRTDNGFTTRNNYREVVVNESLWFRPNRSVLVGWGPWVNVGRQWNHETGDQEDEWLRLGVDMDLTGQTSAWANTLFSNERFGGRVIGGIQTGLLGAETRPTDGFSAGAEVRAGKLIYRSSDPFLGDSFRASVWGTIKPSGRLVIEPSWDYEEMGRPEAGGKEFAGYTLRVRTNFQFSRELFLRLVTQYSAFSERVDVEPLLTYRVNPFTVFFLGAASNFAYYDANPPETSYTDSEWQMTDRRFFAKIQYLLRM